MDITSFTVITEPAVEHIGYIRGRMPVILEESAYDAWLSNDAKALLLDSHLDSQVHSIGSAVS